MDPILQDLFSLNTTEPAVVFAISDRLEELGRMRELGILRSGKPWWWQNGKVRYDRRAFFLKAHFSFARGLEFPAHAGYTVYVARQSYKDRFFRFLANQTNMMGGEPRPCSLKRAVQVGWRYYHADLRDELPYIRHSFYLGVPYRDIPDCYTSLPDALAMCEVACHRLAFPVPIS